MNSPPAHLIVAEESIGARHGFTLVEALLILTVLGILTAIVIPKSNCCTRGELVRASTVQISAFKTALDIFKQDNGYYPTGTNGLDALVKQPNGATNWHQYMDSIPPDPWEHKYIYEFPGRHNPSSFDLMSMGPDGKAGTKDDITNWQPRN